MFYVFTCLGNPRSGSGARHQVLRIRPQSVADPSVAIDPGSRPDICQVMFKSNLKKKLAPTVKKIVFEQNCVFRGFRPVFGVGEGRETSRKVPTCLGNVFGTGGSI